MIDMSKEWDAANRPQLRALSKAWRLNNRAKVRAYKRDYYKKNRNTILATKKKYPSDSPEVRRNRLLKTAYGISREKWQKIFDLQGRRCAICRTSKFEGKGPQTDHCGKAGHVRGILCHRCNTAIGSFRHSERIISNALRYVSEEAIFNYVSDNND